MRILIVGAGIGGLALAAHLQKDGHEPVIVEKTTTWQHVGYILGLWPNGINTLESFGFPKLVQQVGMPTSDEYMRDQHGTLCVYFGLATPPEQPDPPEQRITNLQKLFGNFGWIIPDILHTMSDPEAIFHGDINQVLLEQWYQGRVVLLGDAAHAVAPTVGMGASMALEDAYVLAGELRMSGTVEQALAGYVKRRKPRVTTIRRASDFLNWFTLIEHPAAAWLRNTVVRSLPASFMLRDIEKIVATTP